MPLFKNIYHELQSRSKDALPFADFDTVVSTLTDLCMQSVVEVPRDTDEDEAGEIAY